MPDTYMKDIAHGSGQHRRNFLFLMYCCAVTTADPLEPAWFHYEIVSREITV
jgi:hypothetical protein